ncbi:hypothetical protein [Massilia niabensis]|uniref:Uncharacterized protein n=1 Tax=Massilia niabensis TaxID=544910 RepID=A0ABW0L8U4_9BURK
MDEQEEWAELRRCGIVTIVMIAAGLAVLAVQGEAPAAGALANTGGAPRAAGSNASARIAVGERARHPARPLAARSGALAVPSLSAGAAIPGK